MVKIVTKFDIEALKSLNKFSIKKLVPTIIICMVLFIFLGLTNLFGEDKDLFFGIMLIVVGVLFMPFLIVFTQISQNSAKKTMPLLFAEPVSTFIFDEDKFSIEEVKDNFYRGTTEAVYAYFYKAYETDTHFFLYISQAQCHVLAKKDIVEGSAEELRILLFRHLGPKKFILKKGKK